MFILKSKYDKVLLELDRCKNREGKIYASFDEIVRKYGKGIEKRFRETLDLHMFVTDDRYEFTPEEYVYVCTGRKG